MYKAIQKFLFLHNHLSLPGIGNFSVETTPAQIDFTNRSVTSSQKKINFNNDKLLADKLFYTFISHELNVDEVQAIKMFTDFTAQTQQTLNAKQAVSFNGIGTLTKQTSHVINFQPDVLPSFYPELTAERVIRKNVAHTVRVGEDEKTSEEMQTVLHQPKIIKKERWWIAAVILAVIGIAAIAIYYATHTSAF